LYDQTLQLSRLVEDLRDLAQAEAHQLPIQKLPVDIGSLISQVSGTFAPLAEAAGVGLQTSLESGVPSILGDHDRLAQCLGNLLTNAIRHTPEGGAVTLSLTSNQDCITIQIQDTGAGIPAEHLPHIFDRFYRTDPARSRTSGGLGLGLAITRVLIEAHGGEIEAHSQGAGLGSTFQIRLPVNPL
jgi:two-component system sensor histidine kinase BaeS